MTSKLWHCRQFKRQEMLQAYFGFSGRGLVFRGHAFYGIGDPAAHQLQAVIGIGTEHTTGKAVADQGAVQQVAGIIAGEGAAGTVGTLQARGKADNKQGGVLIAP